MKTWVKLSFIGFLVLLINSAYLVSSGEPTLFYIFNVLVHVVIGLALAIPFVVYAAKYFTSMPILGKASVGSLAIGVATGGYLMVVGATRPLSLVTYLAYRRHDAWCAPMCHSPRRAGKATACLDLPTKSGKDRGRRSCCLPTFFLRRTDCRTLSTEPRLSRQESIIAASQYA